MIEERLEQVRAICLALPEAQELPAGHHAGFEVRGKRFALFLDDHHGDGRLALWCKAAPGFQDELVRSDPERYFVPPYLGPRGWIGVRLESDPPWPFIAELILDSYRMLAPRRLAAQARPGASGA